MKVLISFSVILLTLIKPHSVLSQHPTCGSYDFNDPLILSELEDCSALPGSSGSRPLVIESYSDSLFSPYRSESEYFLTTNKSVNSDITQCIATKALFRGNFSSFSFQIGINLRNNNNTDEYNNVQLFVSNILAFQINPATNVWATYERNYSLPNLGTFDYSIIGLKVRIGNNSDLAIEFIKFYDPKITDPNCVPLYTSPPETTTEATTLESETPTPETETPSPETEIPSTTEAETPIPEIEDPACLEVDFNNSTSLIGTFKECHLQYLPELVIKSYMDSTITPYRDTSSFYLSNKWEGLSCLETISNFSLTESSFIESIIFLNGVWPGAWIEFSVVDVNTGEREVIRRLELSNNWIRLSEEIKGKYNNAQLIIQTNMNAYSQLAVEYFNIRGGSC